MLFFMFFLITAYGVALFFHCNYLLYVFNTLSFFGFLNYFIFALLISYYIKTYQYIEILEENRGIKIGFYYYLEKIITPLLLFILIYVIITVLCFFVNYWWFLYIYFTPSGWTFFIVPAFIPVLFFQNRKLKKLITDGEL